MCIHCVYVYKYPCIGGGGTRMGGAAASSRRCLHCNHRRLHGTNVDLRLLDIPGDLLGVDGDGVHIGLLRVADLGSGRNVLLLPRKASLASPWQAFVRLRQHRHRKHDFWIFPASGLATAQT